jgi:phosphomannomutase
LIFSVIITLPTFVHITSPPFSLTTFSTKDEALTPTTKVPFPCFFNTCLDKIAPLLSPQTMFPLPSINIALSASPSKAIAKSDPVSTTKFETSFKFSLNGSGSLEGKYPSGFEFDNYRHDRIDGIRVWLNEKEWFLIRPSGTEPIIRIFAESDSEEKAKELLKFAAELTQNEIYNLIRK